MNNLECLFKILYISRNSTGIIINLYRSLVVSTICFRGIDTANIILHLVSRIKRDNLIMQNIEFKCELRDMTLARYHCKKLEAKLVGVVEQMDTYYKLPDGRLKRRIVKDEPVEWIFYHRPDRVTPKMSHFMIYSEEQARARWGVLPLKDWLVIRKVREIYILNNIRIHLDDVEQLGQFIEYEAQVSPKYNVRVCHDQIATLRHEFAPILGEAIAYGYADMMDRILRAEIA